MNSKRLAIGIVAAIVVSIGLHLTFPSVFHLVRWLSGWGQQSKVGPGTQSAQALYNEKCKTVAGIRINRTVADVEGLLLLKTRPVRTAENLVDPMWPAAAFGRETYGDGYIESFLGNEYPAQGPIDATHRGIINVGERRSGSLTGYRWVEIVDPSDGRRYRYTLSKKVVGRQDPTAYNVQAALKRDPAYDLNVYRWMLDKVPSPSDLLPRYAVSFEDHVIPEERALGIASGTVTVLDLTSNEVLGEMTRYAITYSYRNGQSPAWLNHRVCPRFGTTSDSTDTRQFVDKILIPKRDD